MPHALGPRASHVYQLLLDRIRCGELGPGMRLPAHTQLAAAFGVAPLTVRQVLAQLEAQHLVVRERGRGTFVRYVDTADTLPVLIVTADRALRADLAQRIRAAAKLPVLAATPAEAVATLEREGLPSLVIVDLHLPRPSAGLQLVRRLRQRLPAVPVAILNPTRGQRGRLERSVAAPLLFLVDPIAEHLSEVLGAALASAASSARVASSEKLELLLERYAALQLAGERSAARSLIVQEGLAAGLRVAQLYRSVLQPAQYRIGALWQANQISVAREHLATAVTDAVMVDLAASAPHRADTGVRVVVACVEGEFHDIGARMLADLLELDGFSVRFLGADVPTDSLLGIIREESPDLVLLSATMSERLAALRAAVARLRHAYGAELRIFVGGQIVDWLPQSARALEADLATRDPAETLSAARRLVI
jgi:methanogenic corrinoid protein MtbC1/DNA-binding transcriptional regulator YhcF (GntR family)